MNNLRRFTTEAEYSAATLNYPAVSWVVSGDTVHFDKSGSTPTVNDKVIIAAYEGVGEGTLVFFNCAASSSGDITSITVDDVEVNPITCEGDYVDGEQTYIVKYTLNTTSVGDWCSGDLGCDAASVPSKLDVLIPSQITAINHLPNNLYKLVVEATTPPTIAGGSSAFENFAGVYVPDASVTAYQNAWGSFASQSEIHPISEYQGNLPV
jgi:hypothetical protein